jgi:ATP-dependent RNA circularization protein (DNA/RNA ligase family)
VPSLPETIYALRREGKLPSPFSTEDVRKLLKGKFADTYLKTVLSNYCEGTGEYVMRGQKAWFRRVGKGLYDIL